MEEIKNSIKLNEGLIYSRMLPLEYSAILLICIKELFVLKTIFDLYLEWPFYTGLTASLWFYCITVGSAVCLTRDRGAAGSSLTDATALCP